MSGMSALLSFTAENVRCYRDEVHLSLLGTRMAEDGVVRRVFTAGSTKPTLVLPAAGVFGANASGKTAILEAIDDMRSVVEGSFRLGTSETSIYRRPFLLDDESRKRPSRFEVDLILNGVRWQYGFELLDDRVLDEYAYHYPRGRQAMIFERNGGVSRFGPPYRSDGKAMLRALRDNALLLSVAEALKVPDLSDLHAWFRTMVRFASSKNSGERAHLTANLVESTNKKDRILNLLRYADLGVTDIHRELPPIEIAERVRKAIRVLNDVDDDAEIAEEFNLEGVVLLTHSAAVGEARIFPQDESLGTQVWLGLIGPLLEVLEAGAVLLVDELDGSLHPRLVQKFVRLFQNTRTNPHCAQLIFNSHDTNLLGDSDSRTIGRDQIWFTEKDTEGASSLYSATNFGPRRDDAIQRRYLQGRYGAVPSLNPADLERALLVTDR